MTEEIYEAPVMREVGSLSELTQTTLKGLLHKPDGIEFMGEFLTSY